MDLGTVKVRVILVLLVLLVLLLVVLLLVLVLTLFLQDKVDRDQYAIPAQPADAAPGVRAGAGAGAAGAAAPCCSCWCCWCCFSLLLLLLLLLPLLLLVTPPPQVVLFPRQFLDDVTLIWSNCKQYNSAEAGQEQTLWGCADALQKFFCKVVKKAQVHKDIPLSPSPRPPLLIVKATSA